MAKRKPFNRELYEQYDELAKQYAIAILESSKLQVRANDKKTAVDLIVFDSNSDLFFVEVEIKKYIKPKELFLFDTLHIPQRKNKYCNLELPTLFMLLSECGKKFMCVWDKFVLTSPTKEVANKYVSNGELFFDVNIKDYVDNSIDKALKRKWKR